MTRYLKQNAVCVINCSWDKSELEKQLPAKMRKDLAEKQALMANGSGAIPQTYSQMFFSSHHSHPNNNWGHSFEMS